MTSPEPEPGHDEIGHNGYCNALVKQPEYDGDRCQLPAGWGTLHVGTGACRKHGGSTRNHIRFAELVEARQYVDLFGGRKDIDPHQALIELVQSKAREVEYWRYRVGLVAEEDLTWGTTKITTGEHGGTTEEAKPHIALVMLQRAERDLADYSTAAIRAGVASEMVQRAARDELLRRLESIRTAELAKQQGVVGRPPELVEGHVIDGPVDGEPPENPP